MARTKEGGAPGIGHVGIYVAEDTTMERPVQLRLTPPGRAPVNMDMSPDEARDLGMGLINAADQARAQRAAAEGQSGVESIGS